MTDILQLKSYYSPSRKSITVTAEMFDHVAGIYGPAIIQQVMENITTRLTEQWLETHGPEVMEGLVPGAIATTIRTAVEKRIAERLFTS